MKNRKCFVSNSSSSSFIMIGLGGTEDELQEKVGNHLFSKDSDIETLYTECDVDYVIGTILTDVDGEIESMNFNLSQIQKIITTISKKLEVPENEIKLYTGTRPA